MLYVCAIRFNVIENLEKFLDFDLSVEPNLPSQTRTSQLGHMLKGLYLVLVIE